MLGVRLMELWVGLFLVLSGGFLLRLGLLSAWRGLTAGSSAATRLPDSGPAVGPVGEDPWDHAAAALGASLAAPEPGEVRSIRPRPQPTARPRRFGRAA
jgi:hypothetical protein